MKKTLKNQFQEVTITVTSYSLDPYNFFRQMFLAKFYSDVKPLGTPSVCLAVIKSRPDGRRSRHFIAPPAHFSQREKIRNFYCEIRTPNSAVRYSIFNRKLYFHAESSTGGSPVLNYPFTTPIGRSFTTGFMRSSSAAITSSMSLYARGASSKS